MGLVSNVPDDVDIFTVNGDEAHIKTLPVTMNSMLTGCEKPLQCPSPIIASVAESRICTAAMTIIPAILNVLTTRADG